MRPTEARRIPGRHPLIPGAGAGVELVFDPEEPRDLSLFRERVVHAWRELGWDVPVLARKDHSQGVSVGVLAPPDMLAAAAVALEWAASPSDDLWQEMLREREREENPRLRQLLQRFGPEICFADDDGFTLGLGIHARTWPLHALPADEEVASGGQRIPFVFVTGTNGKTTTARMLARICREAGYCAGHTSSDGVVVDGAWVERGDWTGPGAARTLLRDRRVGFAVLETARGGLLRRGLAVTGADAAVVTNITDDHLGDWGCDALSDLTWAKMEVARALRPGGVLVLRRGDPELEVIAPVFARERPDVRIRWFAIEGDADGTAKGGHLFLREDGPVVPLDEVPTTFGGLARHNAENALAAALLARSCGIPVAAVSAGLRGFQPSVDESRGRLNRFRLPGGARVLVDYAHNADGVRQLIPLVQAWRRGRVSVLLGQAGDRPQPLLRTYTEATLALGPDLVILKELPRHFRGKRPGEMPAIFRGILEDLGYRGETAERADEVVASRHALDHAGPDDLAILLIHEELPGVLDLLRDMGARPEENSTC